MEAHVEESKLGAGWLLVVDGDYYPFPSRASAENAARLAAQDPQRTGFLASIMKSHPLAVAIQKGESW